MKKQFRLFTMLLLVVMPFQMGYSQPASQTSRGYLPLTEHVLMKKAMDGSEVVIECGSVFKVAQTDRYILRGWRLGDFIQVKENLDIFKNTKYKVHNKRTDEDVQVNLSLGPIKNRDHFKYIDRVSLNRNEVEVRNQNGYRSVWSVQEGYESRLQKWKNGQAIIIGVNDRSWSVWMYGYDMILINVERNESLPVCRVE